MPRSRSRSMESRSCARISRLSTAPVISSIRSASVDLPWSMCAMIEKLRMWPVSKGAEMLPDDPSDAPRELADRAPAVAHLALLLGGELREAAPRLGEALLGEQEVGVVAEVAVPARRVQDAAAGGSGDLERDRSVGSRQRERADEARAALVQGDAVHLPRQQPIVGV